MNEPSHGELLDAIEALRRDIAPVVDMKDDIAELVQISKAIQVGGKGIKWVASIVTALLTVGALIMGIRAGWTIFWNGPPNG